jgi:signal transduction histidine kinase
MGQPSTAVGLEGRAAALAAPEPAILTPGEALAKWMQEIAPFGVFTTDRELRITSWNDWLAEHSGLDMAKVRGRILGELYPELEGRRLLERYRRALAGEVNVLSTALHKYLLPLAATDPGIGHANMLQTVRIAPLHEEDTVVGTVTVIEDVTQREVHAAILRRQQELDRLLSIALATLLQTNDPAKEMSLIFAMVSPVLGLDTYMTYALDRDGKGLRLGESGGLSRKHRELLSSIPFLPVEAQAPGEPLASRQLDIEAHVHVLRELGLGAHCSLPLVVGDRVLGLLSFASYLESAFPVGDVAVLERIARYVAVAMDRTLREREMVAALRAKDDFLAALSHELRTPLNPVLLVASDSAGNFSFSSEAREAFRLIEKNAVLESRLIDDLLDLTRIEHGKLSLEMEFLDLHDVLKDALANVRPDIDDQHVLLHVKLESDTHSVIGDSSRLQQVFWNVLKNAVKFSPHAGQIWVTSAYDRPSNTIVVRIRDTGIGMDEKEIGRVFKAFAQGDHATHGRSHRFGGMGLGLAISRKIIELHSGRIEATSEGKNRGSTFVISLPAAEVDPNAGALPVNAAELEESGATAKRAPGAANKILLVEDHEPTRVSLTRILRRRGYEVVAVASATDALREASIHKVDVVLCDIGLPDSDGFSLMQSLREQYGLKGIALTGYGMEEDIVKSGKAGFFTHLTKPIRTKVLDAALERVLATGA